MTTETTHWTERTTADFLYSIGAEFVHQLENEMRESGTSRVALAQALNVSAGRVSQVLNNPGNLTLRAIIRYARACGRKVSIVTYDDGDDKNRSGPVRADIFTSCWEMAGKPRDFFEMNEEQNAANTSSLTASSMYHVDFLVSQSFVGQGPPESRLAGEFNTLPKGNCLSDAANQYRSSYLRVNLEPVVAADTCSDVRGF